MTTKKWIPLDNAFWFELEPGDGTHYEFIVSEIPNQDSSIFIASVARGHSAPAFVGYAYQKGGLADFHRRFPQVVEAPYDSYRQKIDDSSVLDDHFVGYAYTHSECRSLYTALAGILAGVKWLSLPKRG